MLKHLIFLAVLCIGGYLYMTERVITHGPGEVAPDEPAQRHAFGIDDFEHNGFEITPRAQFKGQVRVLSKKWYSDGTLGKLSPADFMVGWGPMSDERVLDEILIKQSDRYFNWQMTHYPIPLQKMVRHSANIHIVPASEAIKTKMRDVNKGHILKLKGLLIKAKSSEGWSLESSLTRTDYGEEASELLWLEELEISE